jgi:hypothetical protein
MLLRFPTAVARAPAVDAWLSEQPGELGLLVRKWFAKMRECGEDVRELLHDDQPTACVGDAPWGYVDVFKAHVDVGFFHGAALSDPGGLLEGTGKYMRHVKLRPGREPEASALGALIDAAYWDIKTRLRKG